MRKGCNLRFVVSYLRRKEREETHRLNCHAPKTTRLIPIIIEHVRCASLKFNQLSNAKIGTLSSPPIVFLSSFSTLLA